VKIYSAFSQLPSTPLITQVQVDPVSGSFTNPSITVSISSSLEFYPNYYSKLLAYYSNLGKMEVSAFIIHALAYSSAHSPSTSICLLKEIMY
jgi:hypothetical protein